MSLEDNEFFPTRNICSIEKHAKFPGSYTTASLFAVTQGTLPKHCKN